jgi:phosphatidylglycerophosphatase A
MQTGLALFNLGGGEIILVLGLVLILFLSSRFFEMRVGRSAEGGDRKQRFASGAATFLVWIAQGFGSGRIPWAPGTFGSLVGLVWFAALLAGGSYWLYLAGCVVGIVVSVQLCGAAEKILDEKDPSSVVLDEIIAIPICFLSWVSFLYFSTGFLPDPQYFFSRQTWPITLGVYVLFRLFDIAKPWPVKQSQSLPGGWGVTIDDVLAAVYVNVVLIAAQGLNIALQHKG